MSGLTKLPQGNTSYDWNPPSQDGPAAPSTAPSSVGDQFGAQVTTLDRMLSNPDSMPPGRMPPVAPNPWRDIQSFVGKTMAVVTAPIDMLNQAAASLTFPLAMMLPAFPAVRLFVDLTLTIHIHPHPPTFGIPIPAVGPCVAAGACTVIINGLPAARSGDFGLSAWCGGYFPIFEVVTGSSHCMVQGARPARITDITLHCTKTGGLGAIGIGMMMFSAAMGAVGIAAATTDQANALAADAAAQAEAAAVEASAQSVQLAADVAAMALSVMMGMDPAPPPAIGMFITGSPNVVIGGFPMPGWMMIAKGLLKIVRLLARAVQLLLPKGSKLANALCTITGHPVDVASGRVFTSHVDFEFPWRIPIRFERHYDSSSSGYEGPLGTGWTHSYDIHLWRDAEQNLVILRNEEGHLEGYPEITIGAKSVHPLYRSTLERLGEREYQLTRPNGLKYIFSAVPISAAGRSELAPLRLTRIENRNGCKVDLRYERHGLAQLDDHTGRLILFHYTTLKSGRVRLSELRLELEPPLGSTILASFAYDEEGRLTSAFDANLHPYRYAYSGNLLIRETNRNGLSFHFEYEGTSEDARCIHTWGDGGIYERRLTYHLDAQTTTAVDSRGGLWTYEWNDAGLVTKTVDPLGNTKSFMYDDCCRKIVEAQPDGSVWRWEYHDSGRVSAITNPLGQTTRLTYNLAGQSVQTDWPNGTAARRGYDERGNVIWTQDGLGALRHYKYDNLGNLIQIRNATGGITLLEYNSRGEMIKWTDPEHNVTSLAYTPRGRVTQILAPGELRTEYLYDAKDRLIQTRFADRTRNRFRYDAEDNLTGFTNASDQLTEYQYGGFGKVVERIEPSGHHLRYLYDTEENLIGLVNQRGDRYRFTYDAAGRRVEDQTFDGVIRRYCFDENSWTTTVEEVSDDGTQSRLTVLDRNSLGQIVAKHLPSGATHHFEYDAMGRIVGAHTPSHTVTMQYDAAGNLIEERQGTEHVRIEYDEEGQRRRRLTSRGNIIEYEFSSSQRLLKLSVSDQHAERAQATYRYNVLQLPAERTVSGNVRDTFEYDFAGRLVRQEVIGRNRSFARTYSYSPAGVIAAIADNYWGKYEFDHDPAGNLIAMVAPGRVPERFDFDPAGNITLAGEKYYRVGKGNRLVERAGMTYRYNGFGDLIERPAGDGPQFLSYGDLHRLQTVRNSDGQVIAHFEYDALGRRVKKSRSGAESCYLWDGSVLLAELQPETTHEYVFEGFDPILRSNGENVFFYHNDQVGTPRSVTDTEGGTVWEGIFHPWGKKERESPGGFYQPIGRPGQYLDSETGLAYNFFRYYDPEDGRYITPDPIGLVGNENAYYYPADPLSWTDPLGLSGEPLGFKSFGQFQQFGQAAQGGLTRAGYPNTTMYMQGSSVTGRSYDTGAPFDVGRVSDFDMALVNPDLLARAETMGLAKGGRTGPIDVGSEEAKALGINDTLEKLSRLASRPVNAMIFGDEADAKAKGPSIRVPAKCM